MIRIYLICILFISYSAFAQNEVKQIQGYVKIDSENTALEGAKIIIHNPTEPQIKSYGISDINGHFSISVPSNSDTLELNISYIYCITHSQTIIVHSQEVQLDTIFLQADESILNTIIVKAKPNPVTIKNDTILYHADSFATAADANVEDLLEILPGMMVDAQGNITVNGKKVDQILVDGKPFFSGDNRVTTRNLSKDMLLTVEVTNTRTKSEIFASELGLEENKTINLILKPDRKQGVFGEIKVGAGFDNKYSTSGIFNRFNGNKRLSIIGSSNNINEPQFTGNQQSKNSDLIVSPNSSGIKESTSGGLNFSDALTDKINLTTSYLYSNLNTHTNALAQRETILPESRFFSMSNSENTNINQNHNLNLDLDFRINPKLLINISPQFTYQNSNNVNTTTQEQLNATYILTNFQEQASTLNQINRDLKNKFALTQLIGENGTVFKVNLSTSNRLSQKTNLNYLSTFISADSAMATDRNQLIYNQKRTQKYYANSSLKLPLISDVFFLTFAADYKMNQNEFTQNAEQLLETGESFADFNYELINTHFDFEPSVKFTLRKKKWDASLKTLYADRTRKTTSNLEMESDYLQVFKGLEIMSRFNYQINSKLRLTTGYQLGNAPPLLYQVQTFPNLTNPLNVLIGNALLKSSNRHHIKLGIQHNDFATNQTLFITSNLSINRNQIIRSINVDENLFHTTTYINVNGGYNFSNLINYSKRFFIDSLSQLNLDFSTNASMNRLPKLNYGLNYASMTNAVSLRLKFNLNRGDWLRIMGQYQLSFIRTHYDDSNFEAQSNTQHSAQLGMAFTFLKNFNWGNNLMLTYNPSIGNSFQKLNWMWNTNLNYSFPNKKTKLSLVVFDVFGQNQRTNHIVTPNYIEDSESLVLTRYLMLNLTWKFSRM